MLPESDWPRLCEAGGLRAPGAASGRDVDVGSVSVLDSETSGVEVMDRSQGCGETRWSTGADTGVGIVDAVKAVVADLGVIVEPAVESGVKGVNGVRDFGESSVFTVRQLRSCDGVPDLSRLMEIFLAN